MIPIYTGFDRRESVGWHAFAASVMEHTSEAVAFAPVSGRQRDGSNAFTYARFMVPFLQRYEGWALFADACDMVVTGDIGDLWALRDKTKAVQVVKHCYDSKHPRKYVGTRMESVNVQYSRKNWASLMLMNCAHPAWKKLEQFFDLPDRDLLQFKFLKEDEIGELPAEWNWLVDEYGPNPEAKLLHWTAGIPAFKHYETAPQAEVWKEAHALVNHATD
jgi:lipopolysaccharide biosynthesis glycosyltransferase